MPSLFWEVAAVTFVIAIVYAAFTSTEPSNIARDHVSSQDVFVQLEMRKQTKYLENIDRKS